MTSVGARIVESASLTSMARPISWIFTRVVGLAPGPTAVFTLGMLLLCAGRTPLHLAVLPLLWTLIAGATAWVLAIPQDLPLPVAGIGAFALMLWKNRREKRS